LKTPITQQEAAELLGITDREVRNRLKTGELQGALEDTHWHGGKVRKVILESLPAAAQLGFWNSQRVIALPDRGAIMPLKQDSGFRIQDSEKEANSSLEPLPDSLRNKSPELRPLPPTPTQSNAQQLQLPL